MSKSAKLEQTVEKLEKYVDTWKERNRNGVKE